MATIPKNTIEEDIASAIPIWELLGISEEEYYIKFHTPAPVPEDEDEDEAKEEELEKKEDE